jgi:hypothetical protein
MSRLGKIIRWSTAAAVIGVAVVAAVVSHGRTFGGQASAPVGVDGPV